MFSQKLTRSIAVGTAAIALAIGAYAIGSSSSSNGSSPSANAATLLQGQNPRSSGQGPRPGMGTGTGQNQTVVGQAPQGWHSGSGTIITGAAADKAEAAAVAKYPGGTVNRVLQLSDGSYAVHMIQISWPHHVFVNTNFQVTGAIG
ncbi:MAG: hypothetical protein QOG33_492 [Gaiellales bacterium]|jgi:hypothetical protein|nr:hypothetical protein [Gaiellales bacterium]